MSLGSQLTSRACDWKRALLQQRPPTKMRETNSDQTRGKRSFCLKCDHMSSRSLLTHKMAHKRTGATSRILSWVEFDGSSSAHHRHPHKFLGSLIILLKFVIFNLSQLDAFNSEKPGNCTLEYKANPCVPLGKIKLSTNCF